MFAKENNVERKIDEAMEMFKLNNIKSKLQHKKNGHFYVWDINDKMYNYFAKDGSIAGHHNKGIVTMCRIALLDIVPRKKDKVATYDFYKKY